MRSAITGCQLGERILNWSNLRCSLGCYCTLWRRRKKKEAFVLVMSNHLIENLVKQWRSCLLPAKQNTWRATVESPMDSCTLISILDHKWKPLEWLQEAVSAGDVCLDNSWILLACVKYLTKFSHEPNCFTVILYFRFNHCWWDFLKHK